VYYFITALMAIAHTSHGKLVAGRLALEGEKLLQGTGTLTHILASEGDGGIPTAANEEVRLSSFISNRFYKAASV
jgi:hypothetical protein